MFNTTKLQLTKWMPRAGIGITATLALSTFAGVADAQAQTKDFAKVNHSPDKVYVYGETPQPNQVRQNYVAFSREQGKVVGAFYSPRSEFTCFVGSQTNKILDVNAIAGDGTRTFSSEVKLADLHQVPAVSSNDHRIVGACKTAMAEIASR